MPSKNNAEYTIRDLAETVIDVLFSISDRWDERTSTFFSDDSEVIVVNHDNKPMLIRVKAYDNTIVFDIVFRRGSITRVMSVSEVKRRLYDVVTRFGLSPRMVCVTETCVRTLKAIIDEMDRETPYGR